MKNGARASLFAIALIPALSAVAGAQNPKTVSSMPAKCIAIVIPTLEGVAGNATEAAGGVKDVIESYLKGPSVRVLALEAKLPSQARDSAQHKGRGIGGGPLVPALRDEGAAPYAPPPSS